MDLSIQDKIYTQFINKCSNISLFALIWSVLLFFSADEVFPAIQFLVRFHYSKRYLYILVSHSWVIKFSWRERLVTIFYNDVFDFEKVCQKVRQQLKGEIVSGVVGKDDFSRLLRREIAAWRSSDYYKVLEPVRYIGPQVPLKLIGFA